MAAKISPGGPILEGGPKFSLHSSLKLPESGKYNSQRVIGTTIFSVMVSCNQAWFSIQLYLYLHLDKCEASGQIRDSCELRMSLGTSCGDSVSLHRGLRACELTDHELHFAVIEYYSNSYIYIILTISFRFISRFHSGFYNMPANDHGH